MKTVYCEWDFNDLQWTSPMHAFEFADLVRENGWQLIQDHCQVPDVSFRDYRMLQSNPPSGPTIVFVRHDASWPHADLSKWQEEKCVLGYVCPLVTSDPESSISREVYGRSGPLITLPVRALTSMLWAELPPRQWYLEEPDKKPWDVSFVGTMHHDGSPFVREHRASLRRAWGQLDDYRTVAVFNADVTWGYVVSWHNAWKVAAGSKVVVAPWGCCEISWRDYEAALAKAMIIKPRQPQMEVTCSPWAGENMIYCEPDFSDLADRVEEALSKYNETMLAAIRHEMLVAGMDLRVLSSAFVDMLESFHG